MTTKRSVIEWTDEQHELLTRASQSLGMSVPQFCKMQALKEGREINAKG